MFAIGKIKVEESIAEVQFACDLHHCKGACCTLSGGRGAPLEDDEVFAVEEAFAHAADYLSREQIEHIKTFGAVEGVPGSYATRCVDDKDCVFVTYDGGVARCTIEKAYLDGKTSFRKPLSCHLFPIRVNTNGDTSLRYVRIAECDSALLRGRNASTSLHVFLKEALIRKFGPQWYGELEAACHQRTLGRKAGSI